MDLSLLDKSSSVTPLVVRLYDSHRLYSLAENHDCEPEARQELTSAVCELLEMHLTPREHELVADVLISLMKQAETDLRMALSERLSAMNEVPLRLVLHLSNDEIEVARPMLRNSAVLSDMDLIYIIKSKTADYWREIAQRRVLSDYVVGVLVDTGDVGTAITLAENKEIVLDEAALVKLADMAQDQENLAAPLLRREEIDSKLATALYQYVGDILKQYIELHFEINEETRKTINETFGAMASAGELQPTLDMIGAAKHLYKRGDLTAAFMIKTLRRGAYCEFVAQVSVFTGINPEICNTLIKQETGKGLAVLCRAGNIGKADFMSMFLLSQKYRGDKGHIDVHAVGKAICYFERITQAMAQEILAGSVKDSTDIH